MEKVKVLLTRAFGDIGFRVFKRLINRDDRFKTRIFVRESRKNKKMFNPYLRLR